MGASASRVISVAGSAASRLNRYEYRTAVRTLPVSVPSASGLQCTTRPGTRTTCSEGAHGVFVCAVAGERRPSRGAAGELICSSRKTSNGQPAGGHPDDGTLLCHLARGASESSEWR
jgi:hypothetical protein